MKYFIREDGSMYGGEEAIFGDEREATQDEVDAHLLGIVTAKKVSQLSAACKNTIVSGVTSTALGTEHTYPTNNTSDNPDQQNLNGCITESLLNTDNLGWTTPFWCADGDGVWDRIYHTHDQIRAVGAAVAAHVRNSQNFLKILTDQVAAIRADVLMTDADKLTAIGVVNWTL